MNLQAQLTSLKAQAAMQDFGSTTSSPQQEHLYNNYPPYHQDRNGFFQNQNSASNPSTDGENMMYCENGLLEPNCTGPSQNCNAYFNLHDELVSFSADDSSSCEMRPVYSDMEDLQSVAFAYLHHTWQSTTTTQCTAVLLLNIFIRESTVRTIIIKVLRMPV